MRNILNFENISSHLRASRNAREEEKLADVVIQVNARGIPLYDLSKANELLKRGKNTTEEKMPEIKAMM